VTECRHREAAGASAPTHQPAGQPVQPRRSLVLLGVLALGLPVVIGCSQGPSHIPEISRDEVSPALIFNATGQRRINPEYFAYRPAWPAAPGPASFGEITQYRELLYDRQYFSPRRTDQSYRLFRGYRSGAQIE